MAIYSDLNSYTPTTNGPLLNDVKAIYQSIDNILSTRTNERLFNPGFGTRFDEALFELIDDITSVEVFRIVTEAIQRWETRVTLDFSLSSIIPDPENGKYDVTLIFSINGFTDDNFKYTGSIAK